MKEQCHICERKIKKETAVCDNCQATETEVLLIGYRGVLNFGKLSMAPVNMLLTDKRFLIFSDVLNAGSMSTVAATGGGLLGYGLGKLADKAINKSMGRNGKLIANYQFSDITSLEMEEIKKGNILTINSENDKPKKILLGTSFTDPSLNDAGFIAELKKAITK